MPENHTALMGQGLPAEWTGDVAYSPPPEVRGKAQSGPRGWRARLRTRLRSRSMLGHPYTDGSLPRNAYCTLSVVLGPGGVTVSNRSALMPTGPQWTAAERHALANSILVEYTNTFDSW